MVRLPPAESFFPLSCGPTSLPLATRGRAPPTFFLPRRIFSLVENAAGTSPPRKPELFASWVVSNFLPQLSFLDMTLEDPPIFCLFLEEMVRRSKGTQSVFPLLSERDGRSLTRMLVLVRFPSDMWSLDVYRGHSVLTSPFFFFPPEVSPLPGNKALVGPLVSHDRMDVTSSGE